MNTETSILTRTKAFIIMFIMCGLMSSCNREYDGLILTDLKTGKTYLIQTTLDMSYEVKEINPPKDTLVIYK